LNSAAQDTAKITHLHLVGCWWFKKKRKPKPPAEILLQKKRNIDKTWDARMASECKKAWLCKTSVPPTSLFWLLCECRSWTIPQMGMSERTEHPVCYIISINASFPLFLVLYKEHPHVGLLTSCETLTFDCAFFPGCRLAWVTWNVVRHFWREVGMCYRLSRG